MGALLISIDYFTQPNFGIGYLYVIAIILAATYLSKRYLLLLAITCAVLREAFNSQLIHGMDAIPGIILSFLAFTVTGLVLSELARSRQIVLGNLERVEKEMLLRREAEQQLHILIESSPAAVFILPGDGKILLANEGGRKMLALERDPCGESLWPYFPALETVQRRDDFTAFLRFSIDCRGHRENGEPFPASLGVSTFMTHSGPRLAAIVSGGPEDLRSREESGLDRWLSNSQILVSAVSH